MPKFRIVGKEEDAAIRGTEKRSSFALFEKCFCLHRYRICVSSSYARVRKDVILQNFRKSS